MSDLSWLNPTPHAIAVYASQPLSPAATQHSLPSGRYALLGPDFHRLDRTSLRLAHLFLHYRTVRTLVNLVYKFGEPSAQAHGTQVITHVRGSPRRQWKDVHHLMPS